MQQNTQRNHFSIPTNTDFFTIDGLQSSTGQAVYHFGNVVFKELIDNALDACESVGVDPQITIGFELLDDDKTMRLMVSDNGNGLSPDVIERILDFSTRTSDKAAYKSPTRGAQGNALKTILGIPTALGGGMVTIESHNTRHEISFEVTPTMAIIPRHDITDTPRATNGTTIAVTMPLLETWHKPNPCYWVQSFALFNPHAFVSFENKISTRIFNHDAAIIYKRLTDCTKITPDKPTNANSYTPADFYTLAYTTAEQANKPIGEFIRQFDGLKSTAKAKAITNATTGGARFVSDIYNDRATVTALHSEMKAQSKPIQHKHLGAIGAAHLVARLNDVTRHEYKQITGFIEGVPFVFEVLIAECSDKQTFYGVNHSPTYRDFLSGAYLVAGKKTGYGIDGLLRGIIDKEKHTVICHLIGIGLKFTDKGKTNVELPPDITDTIAGAIIQTANAIKRATVATNNTSKQPTFKAVIFQVLPDAIALATNNGAIPANVRNVFYKTRELIQPHKTGELLYDTFTDILTQFWAANGRNINVYNDARGLM
jgi:DNA topoisomerase VI subunit B